MKSSPKSFLPFIVVIAAFLFSFLWIHSSFAPFSLQLIGLFVLILFLTRTKHSFKKLFSLFITTTTGLILVSETGGLSSPLFFLFYFLLFGVALFSSTPLVLLLTLLIIIFFSSSLQSFNALVQLTSLLLTTPIAIIFGQQYLKLMEKKLIEISDLLSQLRSDIAHLNPRQQEILKKIHQKIRFLHQESQKVKNIIDEETDEAE